MRQYVRMIVTGALGLTAVMVMAGGAQASAALSPTWQQSAGELTPIKIERDWAQGGPVEQAEECPAYSPGSKISTGPGEKEISAGSCSRTAEKWT